MQTKAARKILRILVVGVVAALYAAAAPDAGAVAQSQNATAGAAQQSNHSSDLEITRNIRRALTKRQNRDAQNVQAEKKVLPEAAGSDCFI